MKCITVDCFLNVISSDVHRSFIQQQFNDAWSWYSAGSGCCLLAGSLGEIMRVYLPHVKRQTEGHKLCWSCGLIIKATICRGSCLLITLHGSGRGKKQWNLCKCRKIAVGNSPRRRLLIIKTESLSCSDSLHSTIIRFCCAMADIACVDVSLSPSLPSIKQQVFHTRSAGGAYTRSSRCCIVFYQRPEGSNKKLYVGKQWVIRTNNTNINDSNQLYTSQIIFISKTFSSIIQTVS